MIPGAVVFEFFGFIEVSRLSVCDLTLIFSLSLTFIRDKSAVAASEVARLTPRKFQSLHSYVRLSNGLMTTVDSQNGCLVKIETIPVVDKTRRLYQTYPGPLVRGISHKKTVIEFCEDKLKQDQHVEPSLRASHALLWGYLVLMLRQNGNYTEADISELLMRNAEEYVTKTCSSSVEDPKNTTNEDNTDVSEIEDNVVSEEKSNSQSNSATQSLEEETTPGVAAKSVLPKFRDFLLYGNINDALEFATENNLWGHALFLASKVDRRHHANVMLKFANKLRYNDPLQTLYQIMSGRIPSCVKNLDDKWGDWRPHLAMIISNCTDKPDLVKRSIIALGDSLASRGDIYGSQFCYLLVEPSFKDFSDESSEAKIVLLGASHSQSHKNFASDEAIIMSEVYEFARSLSEENFFIPSLQKYKFLLAGKMLDYGMQLKCLLYMEKIAKSIVLQPRNFDENFIAKVYALGDRLKFYDPVMEKLYEDNYNNNNGLDETEDQKWLQDLLQLNQYSYEYTQEPSITSAQPTYDAYNPLAYSLPPGVPDQISQHQTPTHEVKDTYEAENVHAYPQEIPQFENYNSYQHNTQDQGYPNDFGNQNVTDAPPQFGEQISYDSNAENVQQPFTSQNDYGYGYDQVISL
jgi:COPII coat assembly protein SEC16